MTIRMTSNAVWTAGVVAAMLALVPAAPQAQRGALPPADAKAVWDWLQQQTYQTTFMLFPGKEKMYKGREPHGAYLSTYVNAVAFNALRSSNAPLPAGAVLVKENYRSDRTLAATTVMYKIAGYDPEHNDWFWMKRDAAGKVEASGKLEGCISCHRASNFDYVMTGVTALPTREDTPAIRR